MSVNSMTDLQKGAAFVEYKETDGFRAQVALEDQLYISLTTRLMSLQLEKSDLSLQYAKVRGMLDALQMLKTNREALMKSAVEALKSRT